ncbi:AAA family ATPase [Hellea sp.]|nr:AAA family ATPase [Hellea sp.]
MSPTDLIKEIDLDIEQDIVIPPFESGAADGDDYVIDDAEDTSGESEKFAHCIAVMGAAGGVGTTSLCVQLAHNLAVKAKTIAPTKPPSVCLVDLDFESGACSHHLDVSPNLSLNDLRQSPENIDRALVSAFMTPHSSGIDVLAAQASLGGEESINPESVAALLDEISQMYDYVIIDVPRNWRSWNMAAIGGSDRFVIVSDPTIPSLHLARTLIKAVEEKFDHQIKAEVILNKLERRSFRNPLRQKDAELALKREVTATICLDTDTLREAINCGEPAAIIKPDSRYVKDTKHVQDILLKQGDVQDKAAA